MSQLDQAETPLTELDLHRLTGRAGWVAERASLSEMQLETLAALVKHPMSPEKQSELKFWLNEFFAQYIENLTKRAETLEKLGQHNSIARWAYKNPLLRRPKLSTLVRDDLKGTQAALRRATSATLSLSPEARAAIQWSFRQNRLATDPRPRQGSSFRQTWQAAHDAFLYFQVACERMERLENRLSDQVLQELEKAVQAFDLLRTAIEDLSRTTLDVIEETFDGPEVTAATSFQTDHAIEHPADHVLAWLDLLRTILERVQIETKRGRDEAPERALVRALAELYRVTTGQEPGRTYRAIGSPPGEAGNFLALVRSFVGCAKAALPDDAACGTRSLSKIVRQELTERKTTRTN